MNCFDKAASSFEKLKSYCERENFCGWDPYDGLNSKIFKALPYFSKKKIIRIAWIQFFKRSFINFRRLAIVKRDINPKGLALFISSYCNLLKTDRYKNKTEIKEQIVKLSNLLLQLQTSGYSGACWGYNFDWASRAFFLPKFAPTIVVTTYAANALMDAYEATDHKPYLETAISSKEFILKDLKRTSLGNGNFTFSYSPFDQTSVFNASLLGARLLSRIYSYTREEDLKVQAKNAVKYCIDFQNADGSWFYSTLPFHQWIDNFHTGFNLECISDFSHFTGDNSFMGAFDKGLEYYLNTFFDTEGRSKYYNNALFPIDVHAPAQLVVTLSKTDLLAKNRKLVDRVLQWTIDHMQSSKGYFYFQKKRFYTNRIPYMRWSQAWMFYALSHYLQNSNTVSNEDLV